MASILVVEDNPVMSDAICDVLEMAGHQVTLAVDGAYGLVALTKGTPDLIISDIMMPRMDGFEFYQAVRANPAWVFVPFVFLTAKGQDEDIRIGKRMGADDYLVKPYSPDNLLATVDSKLARAKAISRAAGQEMDNMKRSITRVVGHELRTPLTWISGYAELLLGGADTMSPEELNMSLQSIKAGSDRLARLVEDAVLIISLDTGHAAEELKMMARVETNLNHFVQQAIERQQSYAAQRKVRLENQVPVRLNPTLVAPRFLVEALVRILDNGIKFARNEAQSFVTISGANEPGYVELQVRDNGIGIQPAEIERIFTPMVQIDRSRMEQQGVGLGLTVARGLIELHGGSIWAESQPGEGTTVHFKLPVTKEWS